MDGADLNELNLDPLHNRESHRQRTGVESNRMGLVMRMATKPRTSCMFRRPGVGAEKEAERDREIFTGAQRILTDRHIE